LQLILTSQDLIRPSLVISILQVSIDVAVLDGEIVIFESIAVKGDRSFERQQLKDLALVLHAIISVHKNRLGD
jgi:hypothetical protein